MLRFITLPTDYGLTPRGLEPNLPSAMALSAFYVAQRQFDEAAEAMGLDHAMREALRVPQRELIRNLPDRMANRPVRVSTAFPRHHNITRGPAKAGLPYHPPVNL